MKTDRRRFLTGAVALAAYHALPAEAQFNGCPPGFCPIGTVWNASALAIIAAMTPPPDAARALAINSTVTSLQSTGLWPLLDALFILAAHDAQAALLNWKNPSQVASTVNSPTFTTDQGYTGNGTSSYVDTGIKSTAVGSVGTQNSNHIGVYCLNNVGSNSAVGNTAQSVQPRNVADDHLWGRAGNSSNTDTGLASTSLGHSIINRVDSSYISGYKDGALLATVASASSALDSVNNNFICARSPGNFGTYLVSAAHWGAGLTTQQIADLYGILNGARG